MNKQKSNVMKEQQTILSLSGERLQKAMMSWYQSIWRGRLVCNLSPTTNRKIKIYRKTKPNKKTLAVTDILDNNHFGY